MEGGGLYLLFPSFFLLVIFSIYSFSIFMSLLSNARMEKWYREMDLLFDIQIYKCRIGADEAKFHPVFLFCLAE